ncbi:dihydropteroate synthase [Pectinatus brassicae]|uniref:Dihydropteroate synthase n=1 Tax=Pectinatus brassicae TaxID=862415 RepID=A0A840UT56_9FIRM|nr:dihydropteroate synthase [Pectinatus brassicae]MBB5337322.1 dihydropteroate synthase [Pectinatus brassicae]
MLIGNKKFSTNNKTYVMGILNITPDSFSDGGKFNDNSKALHHAEDMIKEGAAIIDIGGESTRPEHVQISTQEEIERVCPIIELLKNHFDIPVSIDTYKAPVARAAITAGADLINDIWGLKYDKDMASVIAKSNLACCLMHNRENSSYNNYLTDILTDLEETLSIAEQAGINRDKIILDPGIGFAKTYQNNISLLKYMEILHKFNLPLLLGTSRKSVIGLSLDLPVNERMEGTLVTTVLAVLKDYMFVRVHDVKENYRAIQMAEAIKYSAEL